MDVEFLDGPWAGKTARNVNTPEWSVFLRTKTDPDHLYFIAERCYVSIPDTKSKVLALLRFRYVKEAKHHVIT